VTLTLDMGWLAPHAKGMVRQICVCATSAFRQAERASVELYAILGAGCVFAFSRLGKTLAALSETNETLARLDKNRSLLLKETAHGVANNFATVAALLSMRSVLIDDAKAKRSLEEAVE
jgi:hypothetical protein